MNTKSIASTLCLGSLLLAGCSASAQKPAIATALDRSQVRHETFEATLRVLDEHPEYVSEFLTTAQAHPRALDRFMSDTARELRRDEFARFVAKRLTKDPEGLEMTLVACMDEASDDPAALEAMSRAMAARPQLAAIVVVQSDASLRSNLRALLAEVLKNPQARRSFLVAVGENSDAMARIIAPDGEVMAKLMKAFARVGVAKAEKQLADFAKALE
jgi:hypothetical protein